MEVPFVGQGPLLCGGAAAAMVARFWGETGVYAEDFDDLVRPEEGGIRTTDLVAAVAARGYAARVITEAPDLVFEALEHGIPPILLLESDATRLHYVVLVQAGPESVSVHDPAFGPGRRMSRTELLEAWGASNHWALLAVPDSAAPVAPVERTPESGAALSPSARRALAALTSGAYEAARTAARRMMSAGGSESRLGRRVLATALFLEGEADAALDEWNALGEPRIDLVSVHGLERTRHDVLVRRSGLAAGDILTRSSLELARRRLEEEPELSASRVDYRLDPRGSVEVQAFVAERARYPGPAGLGVEAVRAALLGQAGIEAGPFLGSGDRWRLSGGWAEGQQYALGALRAPARGLPGVAEVGLAWTREAYPDETTSGLATATSETRLRGWAGIQEWVAPGTRLGLELAWERWSDREHLGSAGLTWLQDLGAVSLTTRLDGWAGTARTFWRGDLEARASVGVTDRQRLRWTGRTVATSTDAPRMVWEGAGTGDVRAALLRGYPLVRGDVITGPAFGPRILQTTVGWRVTERLGPVHAGAGAFVDGAHLPGSERTGDGRTLLDAGLELFVAPGTGSELAVSLAKGGRGWVLSSRIGPSW